ncbi:MAG: BMP family ABC transporter substrate-binding protein [Anaerolineaceae bacterium]|nr:BMP family ABC transporter substrate-binding protein [Anaerolineaceae bacterium]
MKKDIRMSKRLCLTLSVILTVTMLLAACTPATTPPVPAAAAQSTTAPAGAAAAPTTAAALPDASSLKVGLVTDTAGVNDQAFNQMAWEGVQKAAQEMGFQAKFLESGQPSDYETNIDALASEGYTVILTVGASMGEATALKAKSYPDVKFAIIDNVYALSGLANVTSLMFAEDQVGFLAGVLAGGMSRSGFVCSVSSIQNPQSGRYMQSFFGGATWQAGANLKFMNNYINIQTTDANVPSSTDSTQGKENALKLIGRGCDVVFAIGGDAVSGVLLAAKESNLPAIGADVDRYNTDPEAQSALITSTMKNVDVAVYNYLKTVADGSVQAGISTGTLQNGGVGLAPFHNWDSQVPADLKAQIQKASDGIKDGSVKIDVPSGG